MFWKNLAPSAAVNKGTGGVLKDGPLKEAIVASFGSLENLIKEFNATTAGIQGSGWGWLVCVSFLTFVSFHSCIVCLRVRGSDKFFVGL